MPNNGEDDRPLLEQEDLQRHVLEGEFQGEEQDEDMTQHGDAQKDGSVDGDTAIMPQEFTTAIQDLAMPHEINVNRGGGVHGRVVRRPANHHHHLKLQGHMHNARRHAHPYAARDVDGVLDERQYSTTTILSNDDQYSPSTTAPPSELVDTASGFATTTATPHTSDSSTSSSSRDASIQERGSDYEEGSPPSSPVSQDVIVPIISTITLSNTSPILTTISPTPPTTPTTPTTTSRRNPKVNRPHSPTTTTSTRPRRPTSTSSTSSRRRTSQPTPTRTRTRAPSTPNNAQITPPSPSPLITSTPRISNVVHICIVRLPVTEQGGPPPALVTFTSTAHFPNGIPTIARSGRRLPTPSTRINTRSREEAGLSDNSGGGLGRGDTEEEAPALTVTDYHCQLTLPALSRLLHTPTSSPNPTLLPSDGSNVDDSTFPNLGPAAADPTSGDGTHRHNDDNVAFFATPGGKGTIAGISIASAILLISFVLFFLWRKKKDGGDEYTGHTVGGGKRGSAASSFGDSSDGQLPPLSSDPLPSPPDMAMMDQQPQMQEIGSGTGPPGSFFVQRRSQPSSMRGTSTPPCSNTIDAATAARAISPLAMLQQRPGAFFALPAAITGRQTVSKEGHTSGSEENRPSTGNSSSHGHGGNDPFRDPSSTGHSTMSHDPHVVTAFASGDKHERRRSGYTSDTYRKGRSRSRPLSVRNPDSDETQQDIESLYIDRTPRSASSDAIYDVNNAQVPDSAGLEYYLGSNAATPRGTTPIPGSTIPPVPYPALSPPAPQNTMSDALYMPATPRSAHHPHCSTDHQQPLVAMHEHEPGLEYAMPYGGLEDGHSASATAARLEFEPQMEYTYPQPRAIPSSSGVGSTLARPHLHSTALQDPFNHPAPPPAPLIAATAPSNLSRTIDQHNRGASSSRQTRRSTVSSDGASSHSSMWRAWEHSNRSWVNDGFETPNDVQDVQLGSNAGAVGGGNSTSIAGYFSWR